MELRPRDPEVVYTYNDVDVEDIGDDTDEDVLFIIYIRTLYMSRRAFCNPTYILFEYVFEIQNDSEETVLDDSSNLLSLEYSKLYHMMWTRTQTSTQVSWWLRVCMYNLYVRIYVRFKLTKTGTYAYPMGPRAHGVLKDRGDSTLFNRVFE